MAYERNNLDKEALAEFASNVNEEGSRVFDLLQNLLEWSQLQMEGATYDPKLIDLHELTQESIEVLNPVARNKDISVENEIGDATAFADKNMVMLVIRNLIGNGLKFTPTGGKIRISSEQGENHIRVTVADTGVGMSAEFMATLFDIDHRSTETGTAGERGTGLGLPLCKEMVEKNRGEIWVDSKPGDGSQFHFTLPVAPEEDEGSASS